MKVYRDKDGDIWVEGDKHIRVVCDADEEGHLTGAPITPEERERYQLVELVEPPAAPKPKARIVEIGGVYTALSAGFYLNISGKLRDCKQDEPFAAFLRRSSAVAFAERYGYEVIS